MIVFTNYEWYLCAVDIRLSGDEAALEQITRLIESFFRESSEQEHKLYNEAALQHELGFWLRVHLPANFRIQFERPAFDLHASARNLVKKEIDIVVSLPESNTHYAIELKCPRNGMYPEQMFKACEDIQFLEELKHSGFAGGFFVIHVVDAPFYQGAARGGIYDYFRGGKSIEGEIHKPTGSKDKKVSLKGSYQVDWQQCREYGRYWMQDI